ncbi:hypothetical protein AL70_02616, partial [Mycobacterium tuberculosis TKK_03_0115]
STAATSRRSNSRLPTTLNARDQPPAEVSDQRVSGLTGAVHPERGRKLGEPISDHRTLSVVRPKTPRGDGNLQHHHHPAPQLSMSSDPKPREGTETLRRRIRDLFPRIGRQTQNPERGRKLPRRLAITTPTNGRQTQNPERGRKLLTMRLPRALFQPSSDPKPREGTETGSRQTGSRRSSPVVRPKTPRGDGNFLSANSSTVPLSSRQTQNPERGRKHFERELVHSPPFRSSDPKPREGTETPRGWRMRCARKCRQTQNPERGRKPDDGQ